MVIIDWMTKYGTALIKGDAWKNFEKMDSEASRNTVLKVFAIAVLVGIVSTALLPSALVAVVAITSGFFVFSYDAVNFDFAADAAKKAARK